MRALVFLALASLASANAFAVPIYWNTWASSSSGSLTAGASSVGVTFSTTNYHANIANYPSWSPSSTFADGVLVDNGPAAANGIMQLTGGAFAVNVLTFSTPVVDPVLAIWSLGSPGIEASFYFLPPPPGRGGFAGPPVFVAGGPSAEYGGSAITVSGLTVSGSEGNGTIRFIGTGTVSRIEWINPTYEDWYGFNVGIAGTGTPVPEPRQALLFALGLVLLIGFRILARSPG